MTRALILVMDSFGIGAASDAAAFGDVGSDTFGHIAAACAAGQANVDGVRSGPLCIPNLESLGLGLAARASTGNLPQGMSEIAKPTGVYGFAAEQSRGKDTPSGHWEIAGVPVDFDWGYFPDTQPSFPPELTQAFIRETGVPGILGDRHASGTQIIDELGEEQIRTGKPIVYTSSDSVYQIAANETHFGLQSLYDVCEIARRLVDDYEIGRVIARPFVGDTRADFVRTGNRRDYATLPPAPTLLDKLTEAGGEVFAIGKIGDIYAHSGTTHEIKANGHDALFDATLKAMATAGERSLIFTNFVDFDMHFGHRRDVPGYAMALEHFDARLPQLTAAMQPGDLAVITADHGCDPTWRGTDHTREYVPVLAFGPGIPPAAIGPRETFADIGQTIAAHLGIAPLGHGTSFL